MGLWRMVLCVEEPGWLRFLVFTFCCLQYSQCQNPTWTWNIHSFLNYYGAGHSGISRNWLHFESRNQVDQMKEFASINYPKEEKLSSGRFWGSPGYEHSVHHGPQSIPKLSQEFSVSTKCDSVKSINSRWKSSSHPPYLRKKNSTQRWQLAKFINHDVR